MQPVIVCRSESRSRLYPHIGLINEKAVDASG
jgi:hypothetical protein